LSQKQIENGIAPTSAPEALRVFSGRKVAAWWRHFVFFELFRDLGELF
jgi:hypothetical protein